MSVCTSIKKLEEIEKDVDMLLVTIDGNTDAYMIYNYADSLEFLNAEVIVDYRRDVYKGKIETFISTMTVPTRVVTLDRDTNIRLYVHVNDNHSNCCFSDLGEGDSMIGAILYCVDSYYESSLKAVWLTLVVRDKMGRTAKLRLFDYDTRDANYSGTYIKASIKRSKYGFTTELIEPMVQAFTENPEIKIAKNYIHAYFIGDGYMNNLLQSTQLLEHMNEYVEIERGYLLVRLAVELDILRGLKNSLDDIDFKAVAYAIVMRYGYVAKSKLKDFSEKLRSNVFALQNNLPNDVAVKVLMILDEDSDDIKCIPERNIFHKVIELADSVITAKKVVY